jgi:hypothetical protein
MNMFELTFSVIVLPVSVFTNICPVQSGAVADAMFETRTGVPMRAQARRDESNPATANDRDCVKGVMISFSLLDGCRKKSNLASEETAWAPQP